MKLVGISSFLALVYLKKWVDNISSDTFNKFLTNGSEFSVEVLLDGGVPGRKVNGDSAAQETSKVELKFVEDDGVKGKLGDGDLAGDKIDEDGCRSLSKSSRDGSCEGTSSLVWAGRKNVIAEWRGIEETSGGVGVSRY